MSQADNASSSVIFTDSQKCPYFNDGRISTIEFLLPDEEDAGKFHTFLAEGYRRIGRVFYRNVCERCSDCLPLRLEADAFHLSRSHKRTVRKNEDIRVAIPEETDITPDKIRLYNAYVNSKHPGAKPEEPVESLNTLINIHYGFAGAVEMDYYLDNKLIGVGIVDEGADALSSNYFYYDTDHLERRLGVFSILKEIELARTLGKQYYYLGFYIKDNPKMSYKKQYRPNQILHNGIWQDFMKE